MKVKNFIAGFLGGMLGILAFSLIAPILLPVGCIIGFTIGWYHSDIVHSVSRTRFGKFLSKGLYRIMPSPFKRNRRMLKYFIPGLLLATVSSSLMIKLGIDLLAFSADNSNAGGDVIVSILTTFAYFVVCLVYFFNLTFGILSGSVLPDNETREKYKVALSKSSTAVTWLYFKQVLISQILVATMPILLLFVIGVGFIALWVYAVIYIIYLLTVGVNIFANAVMKSRKHLVSFISCLVMTFISAIITKSYMDTLEMVLAISLAVGCATGVITSLLMKNVSDASYGEIHFAKKMKSYIAKVNIKISSMSENFFEKTFGAVVDRYQEI